MHKYRARHGVIESGYFNADRRVLPTFAPELTNNLPVKFEGVV
jgi:hypothetical protein